MKVTNIHLYMLNMSSKVHIYIYLEYLNLVLINWFEFRDPVKYIQNLKNIAKRSINIAYNMWIQSFEVLNGWIKSKYKITAGQLGETRPH